ncbi:MAG: hypothetical protein CXZ00_02545 [Acidobacteria bacterium]|nr:MAG: hypothetical protein CXZ00_02545 [Acidobacteriota bacterium]
MSNPARGLTAEQLLTRWDELHTTRPEERTADWRKQVRDLRKEVERRIDADDPELLDAAGKHFENQVSRLDIPAAPSHLLLLLAPDHLAALNDSELKQRFQETKSHLEFLEGASPRAGVSAGLSGVNWIEDQAVSTRLGVLRSIEHKLRLEIVRRNLLPDTAQPGLQKPQRRPACRPQPDVARRRALVQCHRDLNAAHLCAVFDQEGVPLPEKWDDVETWAAAYRNPKYRGRIHTLISKDKRTRL